MGDDGAHEAAGIVALHKIVSALEPMLSSQVFRFVSMRDAPPSLLPGAIMMFEEAEGWTCIMEDRACSEAGLAGIFPSRKITLRVHSSLNAVGLLALLAGELSAAGISTNVVAGFYHDHFFVPADRGDEALQLLIQLQQRAQTTGMLT